MRTTSNQPNPGSPLYVRTEWLEEPELTFANDLRHVDPKVGIPLYGPRSLNTARHKKEIHIGFIGTSEAVENARRFYAACAEGIDGDLDHAPFPGCTAELGFRSELRMDDHMVETITRQESQNLLVIKNARERFEQTTSLI